MQNQTVSDVHIVPTYDNVRWHGSSADEAATILGANVNDGMLRFIAKVTCAHKMICRGQCFVGTER